MTETTQRPKKRGRPVFPTEELRRRRGRPLVEALPDRLKKCPICEVYFAPVDRRQIYCDAVCRNLAFQRRHISDDPWTAIGQGEHPIEEL